MGARRQSTRSRHDVRGTDALTCDVACRYEALQAASIELARLLDQGHVDRARDGLGSAWRSRFELVRAAERLPRRVRDQWWTRKIVAAEAQLDHLTGRADPPFEPIRR